MLGDSLEYLESIESNTVDCTVTDPPYGMSFMAGHIDWDKALVPVRHWQEVHRVMKDGAFGFIMSIPRQDLLARMIINLENAGFNTNFTSIYWLYATGFCKMYNISKAFDRAECRKQFIEKHGRKPTPIELKKAFRKFRTVLGPSPNRRRDRNPYLGVVLQKYRDDAVIDLPRTEMAKKFDGSYGGYQPSPACEVILVVMKPKTEETYIEQVQKNGKSITWLDDVRIPVPEDDVENYDYNRRGSYERAIHHRAIHEGGFKELSPEDLPQLKGRFPSNLIVSDRVLDTGTISRSTHNPKPSDCKSTWGGTISTNRPARGYDDSGGFSRYFDLDLWWQEKIKELPLEVQQTYPFWIVPKPSKSEKNKGCETLKNTVKVFKAGEARGGALVTKEVWGNYHQTTKPVRLMAYMVTMGSRVGDLVLDPFLGSGTTVLACQMLKRRYLGIEKDNGYYTIARHRAGLAKKNVKKLFKRKKKK